MPKLRYQTPHGITVTRSVSNLPYSRGLDHILAQLDTQRGFYLSSGYEFPGRYSRWDVASVAPLLEIVSAGRLVSIKPLNKRGEAMTQILRPLVESHPHWKLRAEQPSIILDLNPIGDRFLPRPVPGKRSYG